MAENTIILAFVVLVCQVYVKAQICKPAVFPSLLSPTYTAPDPTQVTSMSLCVPQTTAVPSPIAISIPEPTIAPLSPPTVIIQPPTTPTIPLIPTTVVDNRLANSLANVIQLLIVSKLVDSSANPPSFPPFLSKGPLLDAIGTIGTTYSPAIEMPVKPAELISYDVPVYTLPAYSFTEVVNQVSPVTVTESSIYGAVTEVLPAPNTAVYATASEVISPAPVTSVSVTYAPEYFGVTEVKPPPATGSFVGITEVFHYR